MSSMASIKDTAEILGSLGESLEYAGGTLNMGDLSNMTALELVLLLANNGIRFTRPATKAKK